MGARALDNKESGASGATGNGRAGAGAPRRGGRRVRRVACIGLPGALRSLVGVTTMVSRTESRVIPSPRRALAFSGTYGWVSVMYLCSASGNSHGVRGRRQSRSDWGIARRRTSVSTSTSALVMTLV